MAIWFPQSTRLYLVLMWIYWFIRFFFLHCPTKRGLGARTCGLKTQQRLLSAWAEPHLSISGVLHLCVRSVTWLQCFNCAGGTWGAVLWWHINRFKKKRKKYIHTVKSKIIQTPSTFLTLSQFIHYSLENGNKIWQELRVKLCQSKLILIMSDNFGRKVYRIGLNSCQLLNLSTQLDNTKLAQPITKQCFILFSLWCKKLTLAIKEKTLKKTCSAQSVRIIFGPKSFISFTGSPPYENFWGIICHSLLYFAIFTYIN